jgi:uncharacterized protein YycO
VLSPSLLDAFADELVKISEAVPEGELERLKKLLKPGDILYTKPRDIKSSGLFSRAFYGIEKRIQGSEHTHVGLYAGDEKVIDAGSLGTRKDSKLGIHEVPLKRYLNNYQFKVLRVKASPKARQEAVEYAKSHVGKDFNIKGMLRLIFPFKSESEQGERERKDAAESFFCSELVANSYGGLNIAKGKKLKHIWPGDIARSSLTKTVTETK